MANVFSTVEEALSLVQRGKEMLIAVTGTLRDGRDAVSEKRLDQLQAMLEREELETEAARKDLKSAIADYRKRHGQG